MSTTPVNVQIPSDTEAPIIADFVEHALRVAYFDRQHWASLPASDWDAPGVYVLMTADGSNRVYVGQARKLRGRLQQHNNKEKLPWHRALAVKRDTTAGFNTAEIGYLEGRIAAELNALTQITVVEGQTSGDETLPKHMMISLDAFVKSILGALRLAGLDISRSNPQTLTEDEQPSTALVPSNKPNKTVTVADLVSSGLLQAGHALYLSQAGREAEGSVTADGEIIVRGVSYKSPSAAAKIVLDGQASNGWMTWKVGSPSGSPLDTLRQQWLAQQAAEAEK
ncbi:excinuclease ABC subunit C [Arthrobacter sp. MYb229]|uniref:restriction system modified-DNA reader domain-containing protein n=1 Tax=unclassified Arthrobacter TaxID=235627 RepID=UPI000CFC886B|nr:MULTISPECIES: GIY-YIG nuclease family protein [unclassified Arthrobacter]PRA06582.1 excinuclease ABC subunit C [Arthrobacter sp. MYb229]PRB53483.1 excinuclease ABC subunit C [Arthrobacter sp. MYb216]